MADAGEVLDTLELAAGRRLAVLREADGIFRRLLSMPAADEKSGRKKPASRGHHHQHLDPRRAALLELGCEHGRHREAGRRALDQPALDCGGGKLLAEIDSLLASLPPFSPARDAFAAWR